MTSQFRPLPFHSSPIQYSTELPASHQDIEDDGVASISRQQRLFRVLSQFSAWPDWLPDVKDVTRQDTGPPGRGSELLVSSSNRQRRWTISYWDEPEQFTLLTESPRFRCACAFKLDTPQQTAGKLHVAAEFELSATMCLLSPIVRIYIARRMHRLMKEFSKQIDTLGI